MSNIQEPKSLWEAFHMDWVKELPPSGDRSYISFSIIVDRYKKTPILSACRKYETSMDKDLLLWNRVISHAGLFNNIISDRYPRFTSALGTNLHGFFGTKSSFSTEYHAQDNGLSEGIIQALEDMIRIFCAYVSELKDSDFFTHEWFTLIPALKLEYKTSVHSSTGQNTAVLKKGCNKILPADTMRKDLI
ncbi:hypothetical protein O181_023659 [Austropuccinia psidii MF-1]|uniref:Integrase catalytic domain-containing protein n=1 Tax=Austropuccinia psidii MF-1 TaxID=1389203 RepID=A0A9Q3CEU5_9BASI|nr:hypothetical protein [Austropuccinia psidii MF-1]